MKSLFSFLFGILNIESDMGIADNRKRGAIRLIIGMAFLMIGVVIFVVTIFVPVFKNISGFAILTSMLSPLAFSAGMFEIITNKPWYIIPKALRVVLIIIGIFVLLAIFFIGGTSIAPLLRPFMPTSASLWREFAPAGGRFRVLMPGVPEESVRELDLQVFKTEMFIFTGETDGTTYTISYTDFPQEFRADVDVSEILDGGQNGVLQSLKATLVAQSDKRVNGYPGREIIIKSSVNDARLRLQMIMADNRFFELIIETPGTAPPDAKLEAEIQRFLDSLVITPP